MTSTSNIGGCHFNTPLFELLFKLEHTVCQVYCFNFFLHVHLCVNLCGRNAAMSQYLADRIEFSTCRYRQRCRRMSAAVIGEVLFYPCLVLYDILYFFLISMSVNLDNTYAQPGNRTKTYG